MQRQRRGVVGCTNLPVLTHHCEALASARHLHRQPPQPRGTRDTTEVTQDTKFKRGTKHRDKFKLPLVSSTGGTDKPLGGQCGPKRKLSTPEPQLSEHEQAEHVLSASIAAHECASKSFKHEYWYTSPVGFGSKKSVLLSALKARDPGGSGVITCQQLVEALQATNFGLSESQARSLLTDYDARLNVDDATKLPYRSFVNHLQLPDDRSNQPAQDPTIYYQESYVNRVRAHAAHLLETVAVSNASEVEPAVVLPPVANAKTSPPRNDDVDRLSFEFDKERKQRRAEAGSRILLAHINRIEEFSRHQQQVAQEHETLRLAAKALHRHAHFEHALEEENRRLRIAQRDGKGLLRSPIAQMHRNVSKDSMFSVELL